ncbi:MAG: MBL fold metallo-hydrolase [Pseudomonadota bacterium]
MDDLPRSGAHGVRYVFGTPPGFGEAVEVADGVLWFRLALPRLPNHVNVYALDDGDGWTIVDTGLCTPGVRAAWEAILSGPLSGRPVRRVIVTHHHPDHIGNAGWFQTEHGAALWTTRTAWLFARMLMLDEQPVPTPELLAYWRAAGMADAIYAEREHARPVNFADVLAPMPLGFRRIAQGDKFDAGGRRWRVEIGHGHAPDHAMLWCDDEDLVIAGDQVLPKISSNLGVYATEPGADPVGDWMETCARLLPLANPAQVVMPGHQRPFVGLDTRLRDLISQQNAALERLLDALGQPRKASECFQAIYEREISHGEYALALYETVGHLNHLRRRGLASRETTGDGVWIWRRMP